MVVQTQLESKEEEKKYWSSHKQSPFRRFVGPRSSKKIETKQFLSQSAFVVQYAFDSGKFELLFIFLMYVERNDRQDATKRIDDKLLEHQR